MTYTVRWRGLYADTFDTYPEARKHALLAVSTASGWTPTQRRLHDTVRIVGEDGRELESFSVAGELERLKAIGLSTEEVT